MQLFILKLHIVYDARTFWSNPRPSTRPSSPTWGTWVTATVSHPRIQVTQILSYLSPVMEICDILVRIRIRLLSSVTLPMQKKIFFFYIYFFLQLTRMHIIFSLKNVILCSNFVLKFYFASIISVHSSPLWEKGKIQVRTCDQRIRIREAQKHADPPDSDPQHCLTIACQYI